MSLSTRARARALSPAVATIVLLLSTAFAAGLPEASRAGADRGVSRRGEVISTAQQRAIPKILRWFTRLMPPRVDAAADGVAPTR